MTQRVERMARQTRSAGLVASLVQVTDQSSLKAVVQRPGHTLVRSQHPRVLLLYFAGRLTVAELIVECDIGAGQVLSEQLVSHLVVSARCLQEVQQRVGVHQVAGAFVARKALIKVGHVRLSQTDPGRAGLDGVPLRLFHQKRSTANLFIRILEALVYFVAAGVCLLVWKATKLESSPLLEKVATQ